MRSVGGSTQPDSGYDMRIVASDLIEPMTALAARLRRVPHLRRGLGRRSRVPGVRAVSRAHAEPGVSRDAAARVRA
jgi:hypothetical protein